jgi:hypothetical protein
MELGRVGTINFFIISGFFFANKIQQFTVVGYLRYRLFSIIIPWLLFVVLFVLMQLVQIVTLPKLFVQNPAATATLAFNLFIAAIFHAAFWFIPLSILSACLLIVCKKFINTLWFGTLLGGITVFYCINLYHGWVSVNHARSFVGYVFFMWLGVQVKVHLQWVKIFVEKLLWWLLVPAIAVLAMLACREGWVLKSAGCKDAFASIRFSNILLSLLLFAAVLKVPQKAWVGKINPHKYIYGIYLVHSLVLLKLMPLMSKFVLTRHMFGNFGEAILTQLLFFACVVTITYGLVLGIKNSQLRFLIGRV